MSDISATFAPNRCFLANSGGTNVFVGCCENPRGTNRRERKEIRRRAKNTPCYAGASCSCRNCRRGGSAADCRNCK